MNLTIANLFKVPEIRNKILITLGLLLVYRIGFFIPLPGVDFTESLRQQRRHKEGPPVVHLVRDTVHSGRAPTTCQY